MFNVCIEACLFAHVIETACGTSCTSGIFISFLFKLILCPYLEYIDVFFLSVAPLVD